MLPEFRRVRMSRVFSLSMRGSFGKHLIVILSWVLRSVLIRLMSTFSCLILDFRKILWHIIQIKSVILQSISSNFVAFAGLLVDNMQFDAVISQVSIFRFDCISCSKYCTWGQWYTACAKSSGALIPIFRQWLHHF